MVAEIAVGLLVAGRRGNIDARLQLIDEVHAVHAGNLLESAHTEIRQVGRDIRHPAEIAIRQYDSAAAIGIGGTAKRASHAFRRAVKRDVEIAVTGDLAARRLECQGITRLVSEVPAVFVGGLSRKIGDLRLGFRRRSGRFRGGCLCLCGGSLRLIRLLLGKLGSGFTFVLLRFELLHGLLQCIDLLLQHFDLGIRYRLRSLSFDRSVPCQDQNER